MKLCWSMFDIVEQASGGHIIRNTMTGAVAFLSSVDYGSISEAISNGTLVATSDIEDLIGDNGILVDREEDEVALFSRMFFDTRNSGTDTFTLHFLPTIACQLSCSYCFENGGERKGVMKENVMEKSMEWLNEYFSVHNLRRMKVVLFGGEPLLGVKMIKKALPLFSALAERCGLDYRTEPVTNGELLTEDVASFLYGYSWRRLQVTLDGPKDIHDGLRFGNKRRPTFDTIISNMLMVLSQEYIDKVDIRINYSLQTRDRVVDLLEYLARLGVQEKLNLSFGIIMPTLEGSMQISEDDSANAYVLFCTKAKELGFETPVEYTVGSWCVAIEKHSVVLQPDGSLQKCISTVGRNQYNFSDISILPAGYAKDTRFEMFKRTEDCKKEKCSYIPICGGGCPWDALVAHGEHGFGMRFCQKKLLDTINRGLLRLNYS